MKSIWTSTFSLSAHSLTSVSVAPLALGTQWSQKPTENLPAAEAPRPKGPALNAVDAAAVPATKRRRPTFLDTIQFPPTHFDDSQGSLDSNAMHKLRIKQCIFE